MPSALILGASRGLGLGLAREFAGRGWTVSATVRKDADRAALEAAGAKALLCDITDPASVQAIAPVQAARALMDRLAPDGVLAFMTSRMGSVEGNARGDMELYRASKAALNSMTRSLAAKLDRPRTVLSLHPGWVRTDMGGRGADLVVPTSVHGLADVIVAARGKPGSRFLDYSGAELPW